MVGFMNNLTLHRWLVVLGWCLILIAAMFGWGFATCWQLELAIRANFCLLASVWWTGRMSRHVVIFQGGV